MKTHQEFLNEGGSSLKKGIRKLADADIKKCQDIFGDSYEASETLMREDKEFDKAYRRASRKKQDSMIDDLFDSEYTQVVVKELSKY